MTLCWENYSGFLTRRSNRSIWSWKTWNERSSSIIGCHWPVVISSTYQVRKLKLNWLWAAVSAFYGNFQVSFRTVLFFVFFTNLYKLIVAGVTAPHSFIINIRLSKHFFHRFSWSYTDPKSNLLPRMEISSMALLTPKSSIENIKIELESPTM